MNMVHLGQPKLPSPAGHVIDNQPGIDAHIVDPSQPVKPSAASKEPPTEAGQWRGMIPAARWLQSYEPDWFRSDLAAGVTLAAYVLPAALGDASLAGLPPPTGAAGARLLYVSEHLSEMAVDL
jgi:hypothetical protein